MRPSCARPSRTPLRPVPEQIAPSKSLRYLIVAIVALAVTIGVVTIKLRNESEKPVVIPPQTATNNPVGASPAGSTAEQPPPAKQSPSATPGITTAPAPAKTPVPVAKTPAPTTPTGLPAATSPAPKESAPARKAAAPAPAASQPVPAASEPTPAPVVPPVAGESSAPSGAAPGIVHKVLPDVAQKTLNTIRGTVRVGVKVTIDPSGSVTGAEIASRGPSAYFADQALNAAHEWKFAPGEESRERILRFEFTPSGTRAYAE